jgi:dolichol-phosphate mannosyltransferase
MVKSSIAVVIPAYKVSAHILDVLKGIGPEVTKIFVVDDACPENSGQLVQKESKDKRVSVIFNEVNQGVGGAVIAGYEAALKAGAEIIVKLDGDGQMDASLISKLVAPIVEGKADYAKGNRFAALAGLRQMPGIRVLGNGGLSFMTKMSTGYYNVTDPTNGFTAIHRRTLELLPLEMLSKRYFFESDMLFRLSLIRAVVWDISMPAQYGTEKSNLNIFKAFFEFTYRHAVNFHKRLFYNYYLRDMSAASFELPVGAALWWWGLIFGFVKYQESLVSGIAATAGTVMFSAVPLILGMQLILAFINYDVSQVPKHPVSSR